MCLRGAYRSYLRAGRMGRDHRPIVLIGVIFGMKTRKKLIFPTISGANGHNSLLNYSCTEGMVYGAAQKLKAAKK